jgi:hypothetical protein
MQFLRFLLLALGLVSVSAFTVGPRQVATFHSRTMPAAQTSPTALQISFPSDPAIAEMVAKSPPIGSIIMFVIIVSLFEVYTPGRAKKE